MLEVCKKYAKNMQNRLHLVTVTKQVSFGNCRKAVSFSNCHQKNHQKKVEHFHFFQLQKWTQGIIFYIIKRIRNKLCFQYASLCYLLARYLEKANYIKVRSEHKILSLLQNDFIPENCEALSHLFAQFWQQASKTVHLSRPKTIH